MHKVTRHEQKSPHVRAGFGISCMGAVRDETRPKLPILASAGDSGITLVFYDGVPLPDQLGQDQPGRGRRVRVLHWYLLTQKQHQIGQ